MTNGALHLVYGDQKTVARIHSVKLRRREAKDPFDRFGWVLSIPALFHAKMNWLRMIHGLHFLLKHQACASLLAYIRLLLSRPRVQSDSADFFALEELIIHTFRGKILAALFQEVQKMNPHLQPLDAGDTCFFRT